MTKVLVVCAHQDDEVYTVGGTIAKFIAEGNNEVWVMFMTDSCSSQYDNYEEISKVKNEESIKVMNLFGHNTTFNKLPDMKLSLLSAPEINKPIEKAVQEYEPTIVLTHHYGDINSDHRATFEAVRIATRPSVAPFIKMLACFRGMPGSKDFTPNLYVDIDKYSNVKQEAIETYETEIRVFPNPRSVTNIQAIDEMNGAESNLLTAEAFEIIYQKGLVV